MTLQQLRYLIAIAEYGSINAAANNMFASQSNLSTAVHDLEQELGITIFTRSNRGVSLTNDGTELLQYARQVVEQADMLESRYGLGKGSASGGNGATRLAISSQHYYFCVQAFVRTAEEFDAAAKAQAAGPDAASAAHGRKPGAPSAEQPAGPDSPSAEQGYDFILRECATGQIIEDVRTFRSEAGVLYTDGFNRRVLEHAFEEAGVVFTPLFEAKVHVFVGESHPLAKRDVLRVEDLEPYPRYSFEQGSQNSFYYSEEPLAHLPHARNIRYSDRGTLTNLLTHYDGYTLSTGVLSEEMLSGIVAIPLETDVRMQVGYIMHAERRPSRLLERFIENLRDVIRENPTVEA